MKRSLLALAFLVAPLVMSAQKNSYTTTGGELIFSFADVKIGGAEASKVLRFSPFFNIQTQYHHDLSDKFGWMSGFTLHNIGFIFDDPYTAGTRYKVRTYSIGIPLGIKFGRMDGKYFFGGYEIELPFNYKQKTFVNDEKTDKYSEWFSGRTPTLYHTLFFGMNLVQGTQLKFKYYLNNFFNKDYTAVDSGGATYKPYATTEANLFYISLSFQILKGTDFYYERPK
jgi:hypothetical protein